MCGAAAAQPAPPDGAPPPTAVGYPGSKELKGVVVTAAEAGSAGVRPEYQLGPEEIRALGVSSVPELIHLLELQTATAAVRGGPTVTLVNGAPTSSFATVEDLPPEAILRVEVLPAEAAPRYGYKSDQLVLNFVLQPGARVAAAEANGRASTAGGGENYAANLNFLRIEGEGRLQLTLRGAKSPPLLESQRHITANLAGPPFDEIGNVTAAPFGSEIDPALSAIAGQALTVVGIPETGLTGTPRLEDFAATPARTTNTSRYRTLRPATDQASLNAVLTRPLFTGLSATLNGRLEYADNESRFGLAGSSILVPADNPFSPFSTDVEVQRFDPGRLVLRQTNDVTKAHLGLAIDSAFAGWRWSAIANADRSETKSRTEAGFDAGRLQAAVLAGDPAINPFAPPASELFARIPASEARSVVNSADGQVHLNGALAQLPAGAVASSLTLGVQTRRITSRSEFLNTTRALRLSRDVGLVQAHAEVPVTRRGGGAPAGLGELSLNLSLGADRLSDFGSLHSAEAGLNWSPLKSIRITVSASEDDQAPPVQSLGGPTVATTDFRIFDSARGETAEVTRIDGGNPDLLAERRHMLKTGVSVQPFNASRLLLRLIYIRSRTDHAITSPTTVTAELEAAFPERFQRDSEGHLVQIDARPLNLARRDSEELRWGFSYSGAWPRFGKAPTRNVAAPRPGSLQIALLHTVALKDEVLIAEGGRPLDILRGSGLGAGRPRHQVEVLGAYAKGGYGLRATGVWQSGTKLKAAATADGQDLFFSDAATVNLQAFVDLDRQPFAHGRPWLRGSRISLGLDNVFEERPKVTTVTGETPFSYQPDVLDPLGRTVRLDLRKTF